MNVLLPKHIPGWLPAALVLAVLLAAGSRLIVLSMQEHAAAARESAQGVAARYGRAIGLELQTLADLARQQAARGVPAARDSRAQAANTTMPRYVFRTTADGRALSLPDWNGAIVQSILREWAFVDARRGTAVAGLLGPVRHGSQWIVAARVPIEVPERSNAVRRAGWSIAYDDIDQMLARVKIGRIVEAGYDFELSRLDPSDGEPRVYLSSRPVRLSEPATSAIPLRASLSPDAVAEQLTLAIRPRAGWYPAGRLGANIALLALVSWLLTFGVHDLTWSADRLRAALAASKRRLQTLNQRLTNEIEQRQELQKSFDHARYHDAFTGLPNRRYFMDQLDRALRQVRTRRGHHIAVILGDIDRFKLINDTLGHTAGDELMVQAARRFEKAAIPLECVLARWGGDQFAVLLFDVHSIDTAMGFARLLQDTLAAPFELRKHRVSVAASMGVTCVQSGLQRAEDVLREADIALSVAKAEQRAGAVAYGAGMAGKVVSLVSLEADLHIALERHEFQMLYQPIVDMPSQRVVGAEALLRWRHPVEGLLAPDKFLGVAEEAGLIVPITRWTIARVCRLVGDWRRRLPADTDFYVSVNLSASALSDAGLTDYVAAVLAETGTPPAALKFELTERGLISNVGATREILDRLHGLGIQLMLDDFGTGYSSLSHLQLFPFDYVKIDRPHVGRSGAHAADSGIMSAMVQIASSLGLTTIAEVVETEAAVLGLQEIGCRYGQGYFFCEPVEAEEALQRLRSQDLRTLTQPALPAVKSASSGAVPTAAESPQLVAEDQLPVDTPAPAVSAAPVATPARDADSPTLAETMVMPAVLEPVDESPTLAETMVMPAVLKPVDDSPTLAETTVMPAVLNPVDDSPTLAETTLMPAVLKPVDDSPTLAETMVMPAVLKPGDDLPMPTQPAGPTAETAPNDDSLPLLESAHAAGSSGSNGGALTFAEAAELIAESGLDDDSPTLAETVILAPPCGPHDDSPTERLRPLRRRPARQIRR